MRLILTEVSLVYKNGSHLAGLPGCCFLTNHGEADVALRGESESLSASHSKRIYKPGGKHAGKKITTSGSKTKINIAENLKLGISSPLPSGLCVLHY